MYDLRTNFHVTLKTNPLERSDLDDFVACYRAKNRHQRRPTWSEERPDGRWRSYHYDELVRRDKCSLDVFWLKDDESSEVKKLPDPSTIASEIVDELQAALEELSGIADDLGAGQ